MSSLLHLAASSLGWQGAVYFDLASMMLTFARLIYTEGGGRHEAREAGEEAAPPDASRSSPPTNPSTARLTTHLLH